VTPEQRAARFFGEEAKKVAAQWAREAISDGAALVEERIERVFEGADALSMVREVECRTSLCRIRVDWEVVQRDVAANRRIAGTLGADGWLLRESEHDVLAFVPSDFEPLPQAQTVSATVEGE
jgi:hypothetical protein